MESVKSGGNGAVLASNGIIMQLLLGSVKNLGVSYRCSGNFTGDLLDQKR
jgi:hypothetical protein